MLPQVCQNGIMPPKSRCCPQKVLTKSSIGDVCAELMKQFQATTPKNTS